VTQVVIFTSSTKTWENKSFKVVYNVTNKIILNLENVGINGGTQFSKY
jgi:hypothetical protein